MKAGIILLVCVAITACAAAGVPYTIDPAQKLAHAAELNRAGRPIPAEKLIAEALQTYLEQGNELGVVTAYFAFANFYKSDGYHHSQETQFFERNGELAGAYKRSASYFEKAAEIMRRLGHFSDAASALAGASLAYRLDGNSKSSCASYREAKALISEKAVGTNEANFTFLTNLMAQLAANCESAAQQAVPADGPASRARG